MTDAPRRGIRIGLDVGTVRIGVARSDLHAMLATPVRTITRADKGEGTDGLAEILDLIREEEALEVIVGLPRHLSGKEGRSAQIARAYARALATAAEIPVRVVDERLTTVTAHQAMRASGRPGRKQRAVVDQVAAVVILQTALDTERSTGIPPGELVEPFIPTTQEDP